MRIGIIGAGSVGSTLARAWANSGHHVALATRNPDDPKLATLALSIGTNASAAAVPGVVEHCEVIVLATPWTAVRDMPGVEVHAPARPVPPHGERRCSVPGPA